MKFGIGKRTPVSVHITFALSVISFLLCSAPSWGQGTIPPIPATGPVTFDYKIPNLALEELFNRDPDISGSGGRKIFLDLTAPTGPAGDAEQEFRIIVTAGFESGQRGDMYVAELLIDDKVQKDCTGIIDDPPGGFFVPGFPPNFVWPRVISMSLFT